MTLPTNIYPNGQKSFPSTDQTIYETQFKKRFRDKTIMPIVANSEYTGKFRNKGTTITIPVLPVIETHKTKAGEGIKYQEPKGSDEQFTINRERYFGLKFEDEERLFSEMDIESPVLAEANLQMADDVEEEFLADILYKTHEANTGNTAGIRSGSYQLGEGTNPVNLYKTTDLWSNSQETYKNVAPDYFVSAINALSEMPGGLHTDPFIIIPTAIANILQTSELKHADWMGDAQSVMRKTVQFLGQLNGATIIVDNKLPMWKATATSKAVYSIFFGDKSAITFADEARIKTKLEDKDEWGSFHRSKMIYDWFVRYPERIGAGFVSIG